MKITAAMLPALLGRSVAYQAVFTQLDGVNVQGAIFLSQALFLTQTPTAAKRGGWFWKEQQGAADSWEAETGMSPKQQVTARRQLTTLGVLEEKRCGVPAKTWYRVDVDRLAQVLAEALDDDESPAEPHGCPDSPNGRNSNRPTGETRSAQSERTDPTEGSFLTETTTEITPSLSEARESIFERAARQTDDGQPAASLNRKQPMTLDWQPDPATWQRACLERGLPADADHRLALLDFREHFAAQPARTATPADWTRRFARWVHENLQRQQAQPHATGGSHDRSSADRPRNDRAERAAVRQQLANPHDFSWADGLWGDDEPESGAQAGDPVTGGAGVHPAGGDLPEDVFECVPECGPAQAGAARTGGGAGAVAGNADPAGGRASNERAQAAGEYLAADDPGADLDAGADAGGFRYADDW